MTAFPASLQAPEPEQLEIESRIPTLIWRGYGEGARPAIIYLAGAGQSKHDVDLVSLETALVAGVTVLSFDMHQHGDRQSPDFNPPERTSLRQFLEFAEKTVYDLDTVLMHLEQDAGIDSARVGIRAISLSASSALAAVAQNLAIRACLSICGSGDFATSAAWVMRRVGTSAEEIAEELRAEAERLAYIDPLHHPEAFPPCAMMMIHGMSDQRVPIEGHRALFDALAPYYLDRPQDCVFMSHPGGHGIRPQLHDMGWSWLCQRVLA